MKPATYKTTKNLFALSIVIIAALFAAYLFEIRGHAISDQGVTPAARVIVVNTLSDAPNPGSGVTRLRDAIVIANYHATDGNGAYTIDMTGLNGTINLTGPLPDLTAYMTIIGPGSSRLTLRRDTGGDYRIFTIGSNLIVFMSGLTITNGKTPTPPSTPVVGFTAPGGGGILNGSGNLTLTDVVVTGNRTGDGGAATSSFEGGRGGSGGGISNSGLLTMTNCSVTGNTTGTGGPGPGGGGLAGNGGGISSNGGLNLTNCNISGNQAGSNTGGPGGNGGGVICAGGCTFTNVTVSDNHAGDGTLPIAHGNYGGLGGGIAASGVTTITDSTIDGNHWGTGGYGYGGGVYVYGDGTITIKGTTISNNVGVGPGSAIRFQSGVLKIFNSTISGNTGVGLETTTSSPVYLVNDTITGNTGGSAGVVSASSSVTATNTIIAANDPSVGDIAGVFISRGHNLIGNPGSSGSGFTNGVNGDQVGTSGTPLDPQLRPLANNGGPTKTHALLSTSPALDAGDNCVYDAAHCSDTNTPQLLTDQRGGTSNRSVDGPDADTVATVDIGAYELMPLANLSDTSTNEDNQVQVVFDDPDTSTITSITATSSNLTLVPNDSAHLSAGISGATGVVTIDPAANQNGTTNITVTVNRTSGPQAKTFLLTVNPVNDAPSFSKGPDQTVNENAGAQTVSNWATNISPGPGDESGQTLTFTATNKNSALFSAQPAISSNGTLTYTPAANAYGTATVTVTLKDNGGTANSGTDTSASQTFTITVNWMNRPPSFTRGADQTVNEDAGPQAVRNWPSQISDGDTDFGWDTLTFQVTNNTNPALFSTGPAIDRVIISQTLFWILSYTPAANANGSATITINLKDSGGTANGGVDTSPPQTFVINVTPVNDAPSFTKGASQTVNEDAGAQTVNNWATAIAAGPPNESAQTLTFTASNDNNYLFSVQPAISPTGTLTYTPAANANGSAKVSVTLKDNGGTSNGGVDTSAPQTFTIAVNPVNDAPSFTAGTSQTVFANVGPQIITNWATNISPGPLNDESLQALNFQIVNDTNPGLFAAGPAISPTGTLTYTPATNAGGMAVITYNLHDDGGTANGGVDTSSPQSVQITVIPMGGFIQFANTALNPTENSGFATVNVKRTGDTSRAVSVDYATNGDNGVPCLTANGVATPKCDFIAALGRLNFAAGEDTKAFDVQINQDTFVEGPETFTISLSNPLGGAALTLASTLTVTITDDLLEPSGNTIDDADPFVRQHYRDFLNRQADSDGLGFWTNQITSCGANVPCAEVKRINVSAAFFLSIEFQQTGYLVERFYKSSFGDASATSTLGGIHQMTVPVVRFSELLQDTQRIGHGVVVLAPGWDQTLESNKQAYAAEFVQTTRFVTAFPDTMTPAQFVDKLFANADVIPTAAERTAVINEFGTALTSANIAARARAVREVAENPIFNTQEFNRAFVLMEYIGYLRRNPNDAPEPTLDYTGYEFWLNKLNQFNGNYIAAEMVKAFISSGEYRQRFGP